MLHGISRQIKKYRYFLATTLARWLRTAGKNFQGWFGQIDPAKLSIYEVDKLPYPVDWGKYYQYEAIDVEIGTGHGELMHFLAESQLSHLVVGFEIISEYARRSKKKVVNLGNALVFKADAYPLIPLIFANSSIKNIYILFPDPWHKKRHNKRRPITAKWLKSVWSKIEVGGRVYFATDWDDYNSFVLEQFSEFAKGRACELRAGVFEPGAEGLVSTHYYKKWVADNRTFNFVELVKR